MTVKTWAEDEPATNRRAEPARVPPGPCVGRDSGFEVDRGGTAELAWTQCRRCGQAQTLFHLDEGATRYDDETSSLNRRFQAAAHGCFTPGGSSLARRRRGRQL